MFCPSLSCLKCQMIQGCLFILKIEEVKCRVEAPCVSGARVCILQGSLRLRVNKRRGCCYGTDPHHVLEQALPQAVTSHTSFPALCSCSFTPLSLGINAVHPGIVVEIRRLFCTLTFTESCFSPHISSATLPSWHLSVLALSWVL